MEAPEKLFIAIIHTLSNGHTEMIALEHGDGVEYIRKDAFIEKACKFLKSYRQDTFDGCGYIAGIVNDKTIEDFKKYMEG